MDIMLATPLFLTDWKASVPISVPADVVKDLKNYHIMGVRFLYNCFQQGQKGAILNYENGMNYQLQISAFLNALNIFITPESPILIVCPEESLNVWHYHLTNHGGFNVTLLSVQNYEEILNSEDHRVILSSVGNTKLLREIKEITFFALVVEELDLVATKLIIKQLKGQFNIGLTNRNFLKQPDQKLFWTMLKWSNPEVVGKFPEFCIDDDRHLENLRYPYGEWWLRLTWNFCGTFKAPTDDEQKKYKKILQQWTVGHTSRDIPKIENKRQTRKRQAKSENRDNDNSKQREDLQNVIVENDIKFENTCDSTKTLLNLSNDNQKHSLNLNSSRETIFYQNNSQHFNSSQETVIYDDDDDDNNPVLSSIMNSFDKPKVAKKSCEFKNDCKGDISMSFDEPKVQTNVDDDDENNVLTSIIKNESQNSDHSSSSHKNDILSLLYGESE